MDNTDILRFSLGGAVLVAGRGIAEIVKMGSEGDADFYAIRYTDGTSTSFTVTNGARGESGAFLAQYGVTTRREVDAARAEGRLCCAAGAGDGRLYYLADDGEPLVFRAAAGRVLTLDAGDSWSAGGCDFVSETALTVALADKENRLTFDPVPAAGSGNPVTSGGVYAAVEAARPYTFERLGLIPAAYEAIRAGRQVFWVTRDRNNAPILWPLAGFGLTNVFGTMTYRLRFALPLSEGGEEKLVYRLLTCVTGAAEEVYREETHSVSLQEKLTFDPAPTAESPNPVTSGGVHRALAALEARVAALERAERTATFGAAVFGTGKFH